MRSARIVLAALLLSGVAMSLSVAAGGSSTTAQAAETRIPSVQLRRLSAQQLAGQRVIFSYPGPAPPASLLARIRAGEAAGVILYRDNISSRAQTAQAIDELQQAAAHSRVREPLLIMTDQEGGQVRRLPGAPALSEQQIGASSRPAAAARQAGRGAGVNLTQVGINVNLAPVLDVYRARGNFIDEFGRSYSSNPRKVAQLGAAFIEAQQDAGVAATAKHFPGLGAATQAQNTDLVPVTLNVRLSSLRSIDELPYQSAIAAGVRLVMVSWARYPALDARRPAGLSSIVVGRELRRRLKFTGVTVTDALEAGALRAYGPTSNRATLAAGAGMDLLLCADQTVSQGIAATNALATALRAHRLGTSAFMTSVKRIISLRSAL
jgi:beta-N-acetylhexosaminidase